MARVLGPCLIASLLLLGEKLAVQLISVNYHRRTFKGRITQSKRDVYLMRLLYEASRTLFPMYCQEFIDEDYIINNKSPQIANRNISAKWRGMIEVFVWMSLRQAVLSILGCSDLQPRRCCFS
jgi:hypothetical protein